MPGYTCLCINGTSVLSSRFYTGYRIILLLSLWTIPNLQNPVSSWLTFIVLQLSAKQNFVYFDFTFKSCHISDQTQIGRNSPGYISSNLLQCACTPYFGKRALKQGVAFYKILYKNHKISDFVRGMGKEEIFPHTVLMIRSIAK